jgi:hypothetical protein
MMYDHPVTDLEGLYSRAHLYYPATGLMSHSLELGRVPALTPGCPVSSKVASAEPGSAHLNDDFRETGFGFRKFPEFQLPLSEKYDSLHDILLSKILQKPGPCFKVKLFLEIQSTRMNLMANP